MSRDATMPTEQQVKDLADAMWQILDDMGKHGASVCMAAKAQARLAYEPFNDGEADENLMDLKLAKKIEDWS
jgi:hypothetical protein